ncbi:amino acid transporter, partial [Acinetobacter baumannii]
GYDIGWTYSLGGVLVGISGLAAVIIYFSCLWPEGDSFSPMQLSMFNAGCVLFVLGLNLLTGKLFGEVDFWFA